MLESKILQVEIGNCFIKIAEISKKKQKIMVHKGALLKTPPNAMDDGMLLDKSAIAHVIKGFIESNRIRTKDMGISVSSSKIITREVIFPKVKRKQLNKIIEVNAPDYFPVNLDEYLLSNTVLEEVVSDDAKSLKVNIIAVPNQLIEEYVELARLCDLRILAVDYDGNSMANLYRQARWSGVHVLIDLGCELTKVTILKDGVLEFHRSILAGMPSVTRIVAEHFHISDEEAIEIINNQKLLQTAMEGEEDFSSWLGQMRTQLNQIYTGAARYIEFFRSRNDNIPVDGIHLIGGGADFEGITEFIHNFLGIHTDKIEAFNNVVYQKKAVELAEKYNYFSICFGAAFTELDLIPLSVVKENKRAERTRIIIELMILAFLLLVSSMFIPFNHIQNLKAQKQELLMQLEKAKEVNQLNQQLETLQEQLNKRNSVIGKSQTNTQSLGEIIDTMEGVMPKEVFYLSMNVTDESLSISGIARDKLIVAQLIQQLRNQPYFSDVFVPGITANGSEEEEGYVSFTIQCNFK